MNCTIYIEYFTILILVFCLSCPPLGQFIPNFGYAPPQELKINHIFWEMMSHMWNFIAFLLSHYSLVLVEKKYFLHSDRCIYPIVGLNLFCPFLIKTNFVRFSERTNFCTSATHIFSCRSRHLLLFLSCVLPGHFLCAGNYIAIRSSNVSLAACVQRPTSTRYRYVHSNDF